MKLNNKTILITGATSGIGKALTEQLYKNNTLICLARSEKKLQALKSDYPEISTILVDLADIENLPNAIKPLQNSHHRIDVLINNAAIQYEVFFTENSFDYHKIITEINTNLTSVCCLSYLLLPTLVHTKESAIVNINSGLAYAAKSSSAVYCATKAALNGFTQSLRYQLENNTTAVYQAFLPLVETPMAASRNSAKLSANQAAEQIIYGIEHRIADHAIGKARLLKWLMRWLPAVGKAIIKNS